MLHKLNNPKLRSKLLKPFTVNVNPNHVTVLALLVAIGAGILFYYEMILCAVGMVILNGFLDILDGEIAKKYKKQSKLGDFLDHTFDRLSDIAILLGITLSSYIPNIFGYGLIIITLLVSYMGTQAQALSTKRNYGGIVGRADRLILISIFGLFSIFDFNMLFYGILILLILSIITFIQRFVKIYTELK